jgi:ribosomal protein S11
MNIQKKQQQLLLSFFYPTLRVKKVKKLINKIRIKQNNSIFKFQSRNQKYLSRFLKTKKNTKLFKNFFIDNFYKKLKQVKYVINIRINPNNTLITLTDNFGNTKLKTSAGILGLHSSKKNYKLIYNLVLTEFFKQLKNEKKYKNLLFRLDVPKLLRRRLVKRLKYYLKNSNVFEGLRQLAFNGCRPPKMRRKKRKGLKITKPSL